MAISAIFGHVSDNNEQGREGMEKTTSRVNTKLAGNPPQRNIAGRGLKKAIATPPENPASITIEGEVFNCLQEDGWVMITHPKWSIMGVGEDVESARKDLKDTASIVASDYIDEKDSNLTPEAIRLKAFLIKYLG